MFRNVLSQYLRKAYDYLKIDNESSNDSNKNLIEIDLNNNSNQHVNNNNDKNTGVKNEKNSDLKNLKQASDSNTTNFSGLVGNSLLDELDWFRPFYDLRRDIYGAQQLPSGAEGAVNSLTNVKFESYYDYLTKFYYANLIGGPTMTTMGALEAGVNAIDLNIDLEELDESSLKAVRLFQKAYYKEPIRGEVINVPSWRMKEKMKTVSAALVLCLNIGVDPPDIVKTNQCSKLECWINQMLMTPQKALEMIGAELQKQYERWQPRARYKHCLDPTTDEVKKLCVSLRKNAKDDRVLFHYNGHGVPKPTVNGEIWVFNKEFTQYIPLSLYEVQTWMGAPSLYVWDCSNAGLIIQSFLQFEEDRENEYLHRNEACMNGPNGQRGSQSMPRIRDSIHLAACAANELLPMHPDLPFDLFTACLTTPIKAALHWYVSQKNLCQLIPGLTIDLIDKIPGQINDRRTMLGELNWIFTAITDTIAWNVLDTELFQKLFRQDLLVASLFRNFLLAERIMKSLDCNPVSHPQLPPTNEHPLWQSWDLALDMCISQLPQIVNNNNVEQKDFQSCGFFTEQIEIFDMWLKYNINSNISPEQLPVVLQVLLSQQHRLKALELLAKFIDMGPWAVSAALSVGIFPYVVKLLSTQPKELRSLLTFIWAKILAVDKSCQAELVKDNAHAYFIHILPDSDVPPTQKVYSAFVLACLVDNYPSGQESAKQNHLIAICSYLLDDRDSRDYKNALLRQWICICLGLCWQNYPEARCEGSRSNAHHVVLNLINDPVAEVRAAAIFALGTYIGCGQGHEETIELKNKIDLEIVGSLIKEYDMVFLVRKEVIAALFNYLNQFINQSNPSNNNNPGSDANNLLTSPQISKSHSTSSLVAKPQPNVGNLDRIIENKPSPATVSSSTLSPSSQQKTTTQTPTVTTTNSRLTQSSSINANLAQSDNQTTGTPSASSTLTNGRSIVQTPTTGSNNSPITPSSQQKLSILANNSINNLFLRVCNLLIDLQSDPHPEVAELAQRVFNYFQNQMHLFDLTKQSLLIEAIKNKQSKLVGPTATASFVVNSNININTEFVPWCCRYFLKPLLSVRDELYTGTGTGTISLLPSANKLDIFSTEFLDQHCKLIYNLKRRKVPNEWHEPRQMEEQFQIKHGSHPLHCKFHPYEDQIFVVDRDCYITVYDSVQRTKLINFSILNNRNPLGRRLASVTSFKLVNVQHEPIFLVGTDDYVVRFFKPDLVGFKRSNLITAFTAISESNRKLSTKESGLILEWNEQKETLLCGGDTSFIKVWDMNKELYKEYSTEVNSGITSLTTGENYTIAGFGDGSVRLFDFRCPTPISMPSLHEASMNYKSRFTTVGGNMSNSSPASSSPSHAHHYKPSLIHQHDAFILKVKLHGNKLISAGIGGGINVFDMRTMKNDVDVPFNKEYATALECHPFNELIAVGNGTDQNQSVKIYDFKGRELSCIKHHDGFIGKRISTVSCIDWNSYKNEIVFGGNDNFLTVFSCKDTN